MTPLSLREVTADPVQRSSLVERLGLTTPVAEVAVEAQGLLQGPGRGRVITRERPDVPQVAEGVGLAVPVAEVAVEAQGLLLGLGRGRVITRQPPHISEAVEGVGLAEPVAEVAVDAQGLLLGLGRGRVITRHPLARTRGSGGRWPGRAGAGSQARAGMTGAVPSVNRTAEGPRWT